MRLRVLPNLILLTLVAALLLLNVAVYGGFVVGEGAGNGNNIRSERERALTAAERAAADDSPHLPGEYVPPQGIQHTGQYPLTERVPFCPEHEKRPDCYASNPPSSGLHLPVQRGIELPDGTRIDIPPNPGIYEFVVPRESIPHVQEHAGVYVGYHCASDACQDVARQVEAVVGELLLQGKRVVMSPDPDLDEDTIGMASWTRVDTFHASDYADDRVRRFIEVHSCRYDPEGFCN